MSNVNTTMLEQALITAKARIAEQAEYIMQLEHSLRLCKGEPLPEPVPPPDENQLGFAGIV